jgi:hypothetical protein
MFWSSKDRVNAVPQLLFAPPIRITLRLPNISLVILSEAVAHFCCTPRTKIVRSGSEPLLNRTIFYP